MLTSIPPQVEAQLRNVLMLIAGWFVTKGVIAEGEIELYVGIALGLLSVVWAWWVNRKEALVKVTEQIPSVKAIDMANTEEGRAIAEATGPKVVVTAGRK